MSYGNSEITSVNYTINHCHINAMQLLFEFSSSGFSRFQLFFLFFFNFALGANNINLLYEILITYWSPLPEACMLHDNILCFVISHSSDFVELKAIGIYVPQLLFVLLYMHKVRIAYYINLCITTFYAKQPINRLKVSPHILGQCI